MKKKKIIKYVKLNIFFLPFSSFIFDSFFLLLLQPGYIIYDKIVINFDPRTSERKKKKTFSSFYIYSKKLLYTKFYAYLFMDIICLFYVLVYIYFILYIIFFFRYMYIYFKQKCIKKLCI